MAGPLTPGQRDVLELLVRGWDRPEIARLLGVSRSAVAMRLARAGDRLGTRSTAQTVAVAVGLGYVDWELPDDSAGAVADPLTGRRARTSTRPARKRDRYGPRPAG